MESEESVGGDSTSEVLLKQVDSFDAADSDTVVQDDKLEILYSSATNAGKSSMIFTMMKYTEIICVTVRTKTESNCWSRCV